LSIGYLYLKKLILQKKII